MAKTKDATPPAKIIFNLSQKLKEDFVAMCNDREMDMTNVLRDLITNAVRSHKRQNGKPGQSD